MTVVGLRSLLEVRSRVGVHEIPPQAFATFSEVAGYLHDARLYPDRDRLVAGVLSRHPDWS